MKTSVYDALCNTIYNLHSKGNNGHYHYASKSDIDYDYQNNRERKHLDKLLNDIIEEIKELYINICKEYEKYGYSAYEYLYSDEYAKDTYEANEYTFLENGKLFNE